MNISCPACRTVYRVDPNKVPLAGVRARCIRCPGEFDVRVPTGEDSVPGVTTGPGVHEASPPVVSNEEPEEAVATVESHGVGSGPSEEQEPGGARAPEAFASGSRDPFDSSAAVGIDTSDSVPPSPFGASDPHTRARRLARALVSDIVVYGADRRERSLRQGTIRQEFREEIRRSWDEYETQVGNEMARGTSYFREALNELLAGGDRLF